MISRLGGSPWLRAGAIVLLLLAVTLPLTALAGQERSEVCHLDDDGNYLLITVADPAIDAHLAHGDSAPGTNGLDENCAPLPDADGDGVLDADDNCPATPNADQSDRYGSSKGDACEDDSNGDGILDVDEENICVSINGHEIIQNGSSVCASSDAGDDGLPNIAVAHGIEAQANAYSGFNNTVTANGISAFAGSADGSNNTVTAIGDLAVAVSVGGSSNTVTAIGCYLSVVDQSDVTASCP